MNLSSCPQIAREALEKEHREAEAKESTSDLVTETDKKVEELIISSLQQRFPKHKWVFDQSSESRFQKVRS